MNVNSTRACNCEYMQVPFLLTEYLNSEPFLHPKLRNAAVPSFKTHF